MIESLFAQNVAWSLSKTREDSDFFRRLANQQRPRYLWIGYSDSRVPANEIVGLDPGEMFVHRNIANVIHSSDMNLLAVLEYAVRSLSIEHIIICGHYGCGGVHRALEGGHDGIVNNWLAPIVDLHDRRQNLLGPIEDEAARVNRLCELNVELQVRRIAATPIVNTAWRTGNKIQIHGWIYGLRDGLLRDLEVSLTNLEDFDRSRHGTDNHPSTPTINNEVRRDEIGSTLFDCCPVATDQFNAATQPTERRKMNDRQASRSRTTNL